ncbi:hypothetical protein GCM10029976_065960 [Kribbella albertanoniae]|uniref:Uncharacterized protein n=1 Tax=Kribbella albertanoniae TaxID=1266829 RepID=A0A4R4Q0G9_9ACTN|nr:hypothetical protein [Kribbella albertanoniae]TDC28279.1 hypothetical protein E1261_18885 [Kribbella albertanoniae]
MARRGTALLASGLVAMIAVGGAGGYGVGWLTALDRSTSATGKAMPLGQIKAVTPQGPSSTPDPTDPRIPIPDNSKPLRVNELSYQSQTFTVKGTLQSEMTLDLPDNWGYIAQDPPNNARFNEPIGKRWVRVESGFPLTRPPAVSMAIRAKKLLELPKNQHVTILSQVDDGDTATLTYKHVPGRALSPNPILRYGFIRWVADESGDVMVEIAVTGLPQDAAALRDILDHASESVVRRDTPLAPS